MKTDSLVLLAAALALTACSGGSQFPNPTGKGTYRSINAISTSPTLNFRIEEAASDEVSYRSASPSRRFDDFEYTFNVEARFLGELQIRRVASVTQKIEANKDFTFVITGAVANPTILTWVGDERTFDADETVAELRFAHLAESVGPVDFYFAPPGTVLTPGEEQGTLAFGEIIPARDFANGDYVLTVTTPDDPTDIIYQSVVGTYLQQTSTIVTIFDGTVDETAPVSARGIVTVGGSTFSLVDARFRPAVSFIQGSQSLDTVDIYNDAALTNQVVSALPYAGTSADIEVATGESPYFFTPAGTTGAILFESLVVTNGVRRFEHYSIGVSGAYIGLSGPRDTQPIEIYATLGVNNTLVDNQVVNVYLVEPGTDISDEDPTFSSLYGFLTGRLPIAAGSYELIVTADESKTPLGSVQFDVVDGDVVRFALFATPDPNVIEILPQP